MNRLAYRITSFPAEAIALAKQSVNNAELDLQKGLRDEAHLFQQILRTEAAQSRIKRFMEKGGQTREVKLRMGEIRTEFWS